MPATNITESRTTCLKSVDIVSGMYRSWMMFPNMCRVCLRLILIWHFFLYLQLVFDSRQNWFSHSTCRRIAIASCFLGWTRLQSISCHTVHASLFPAILHTRAGYLPRTIGSFATICRSGLCWVCAPNRTRIVGSHRWVHRSVVNCKLLPLSLI